MKHTMLAAMAVSILLSGTFYDAYGRPQDSQSSVETAEKNSADGQKLFRHTDG